MQPCFAYLGTGRGALPLTERATEEVVSLPIYPELTSAQQEAVVAAVREFYQG
jgi:dTDP-4-amino-4,6-dideoxygalactose transaminase